MSKKQQEDSRIEATSEIYKVARQHADEEMAKLRGEIDSIRQESYGMGAIKALDINIAQNEFLKIMTLYRIKQAKDYKAGGLTWDEFCDAVGTPRRTADRLIEEVRPLFESFSANVAELCDLPFNKIRLLGRQISGNLAEIENNCLIYGDESIPLTPEYRDDIQALIDRIGEESKEKIEDAEAKLSAKDKVLKSKEDLLNKQERELRRFEKEAKKRGLTPEESAVLDRIDMLKTVLNGHCLQIENVFVTLNEDPFPAAVAAFVAFLDEMRSRVGAMRESVVTCLAPAGMFPDEEWRPEGAAENPLCIQCKSAHPDCHNCCKLCDDQCNDAQYCRIDESK